MIQIESINLTFAQPVQLYLSNGGPAGTPIPAGDYIAVTNPGQQPGWFSLYEAQNGATTGASVASVYLLISPTGDIRLGA